MNYNETSFKIYIHITKKLLDFYFNVFKHKYKKST